VGTFGNAFEVRDPTMLQVLAYYAPEVDADAIVTVVDEVVGEVVTGIDDEEVERATTAMASGAVARVDNFVQRALSLAVTEQQRQNPELVNDLPATLYEVDAKRVGRAADEWLRPARRAVLELVPGAQS
jgi:predicted Zn-dependent peptidase